MTQVQEYIEKHHLKHKCLFCGAFISLKDRPAIEHYVYRKSPPRFCNRSCHGKYLAKKFFSTGKKHVAYKNGSNKGYNRRYTEMAIRLLGNKCSECETVNRVITSYKDGNPRNNPVDGSNWNRICRSCFKKQWWANKKLSPGEKEKRMKWYRRNRVIHIPEGYTTTSKLRNVLGLSRERIRQLRQKRKIPYEVVGKRTYIYDINKLVEHQLIKQKQIKLL